MGTTDLQIKRGTRGNLPTLLQGEVAYCTDTMEFFIGSGAGNVLLATGGGGGGYVVGTYMGQYLSGQPQAISLGFTPTAVFIIPKETALCYPSGSSGFTLSGGLALRDNSVGDGKGIVIINNGFQVQRVDFTGSSPDNNLTTTQHMVKTNQNNVCYHYIAFK